MHYRYERKFRVERLDAAQARRLVLRHPGLFHEPYPPRFINNLYLDTADLRSYHDNAAGAADRHKVRVRWYGDPLEHVDRPVLEFKVKRGLVGKKHSFPIPEFGLRQGFDQRALGRLLQSAALPPAVRLHLRSLRVVLCNRYHRRYFVSSDGRFRITIDAQMAYYRVKPHGGRFGAPFRDARPIIVELKYDRDADSAADRIANFFPFIVTRNSKYVTGIESVFF